MRNEGSCTRARLPPPPPPDHTPLGVARYFDLASPFEANRSVPACATSTRGTALPCEPSVDGLRAVGLRGQPRLGVRRPGSPHTGCDASCPAGESRIRMVYVRPVFDLPFRFSLLFFLRPHVCPAPRPHRRACSAYGAYRCGAAQRKSETGAACPAMRFFATGLLWTEVAGILQAAVQHPASSDDPDFSPQRRSIPKIKRRGCRLLWNSHLQGACAFAKSTSETIFVLAANPSMLSMAPDSGAACANPATTALPQ